MTPQELAMGTATFVLGVLTTAALQSIVARFFGRARPSARVTDIRISPEPSSEKKTLRCDFATTTQIARNPIFPEPDDDLTVEKAHLYMERVTHTLDTHQRVVQYLHELIQRPHLIDQALPKDRQREAFMREWTSYGASLDKFAKLALYNLAREIPAEYTQPHPAEWKSGPRAVISLGPNTSYALFEVDEVAYADAAAKDHPQDRNQAIEEARNTNALRRFWIHLNEAHVRWLLTRAYEVAVSVGEDARGLAASMTDLIQSVAPDYLRVTVMVTNSGERAYAVKPIAYLRLPKVDAITGADALIPLVEETERPAQQPSPFTVKGNESLQVTFRSETPIANLRIQKGDGAVLLDGARLLTLYNGQILSTTLALSLTGFQVDDQKFLVTPPCDFGIPAFTRDRDNLANALKPQQRG
jgi:hypothetical protein